MALGDADLGFALQAPDLLFCKFFVVITVVTGFVVAVTALPCSWGRGKPSTTHTSGPMTMAFAIVSLSAVNIGLVMRRERQTLWSPPVFPTWAGSS